MGLDFAKMGQNLLSSATGNVSKAILVVRKIPIHTDEFGQDTIDQIAVDDIKGAINDMAGAPEEMGKGGLNHELMELARQSLKNGKTASFDKIAKKARLEQLEPMEVAQYYTNRYHEAMDRLNVLRPSIEPHASGHIIEQIELVQKILDAGYAYVSNGSVYFDVNKYAADTKQYGRLSGRVIDEMLSTTRQLDGQEEKHNTADFALWKKAAPEHIMRWNSPWSIGFPGWHTECTAMGTKYLGEMFDIHGGGMDLMFPHHESEIAQQTSVTGHGPCHYWMHNNMITIEGQKMGKSLGNFITLDEFFNGSHINPKDGKEMLAKAYSPMTIRFFILQAHYRSTVDFSNDALLAAEKGYSRLMQAFKTLRSLQPSKASSIDVKGYRQLCYDAMNDDMNTPIVISHLFDAAKAINTVNDHKATLTKEDIDELTSLFQTFVFDIMGLRDEASTDNTALIDGLMQMILDVRATAKANKDWTTSDKIRDSLGQLGIAVKDGKDGATWELK